MNKVEFSSIRKIFEAVNELNQQGKQVINLGIGRPDFDSPSHIKEACKRALDDGLVHYTSNYGIIELRRALASKLENENGIEVNPNNEIIITVGGSEAVFTVMMAFLNPGDEVLIPTPAWTNYFYSTLLAGGIPVEIPLRLEDDYVVDPATLEKSITSRSKIIVLTNPSNPTGAVIGKETLKKIAALAQKYNLLILADELYEKLVYDGFKHTSIGSFAEVKNRVITVGGFSKAYSMTGWRLGYLVAQQELMDIMLRVHQYTTVCATSFAQKGALAAVDGSQECVSDMLAAFDKRRKLLVEGLNSIKGFECPRPKGAFYCFPSIKKLGMSSEELVEYLLHQCLVGVVPGNAFGSAGEGFIRFSYASSYENIEEALNRISLGIQKI